MIIREWNRVKSILTGKVYEIKNLGDCILTLKSIDGSSKVWPERNHLDLFYEGMECSETSPDSSDRPLETCPQEGSGIKQVFETEWGGPFAG